jgi:hypothetical protein
LSAGPQPSSCLAVEHIPRVERAYVSGSVTVEWEDTDQLETVHVGGGVRYHPGDPEDDGGAQVGLGRGADGGDVVDLDNGDRGGAGGGQICARRFSMPMRAHAAA